MCRPFRGKRGGSRGGGGLPAKVIKGSGKKGSSEAHWCEAQGWGLRVATLFANDPAHICYQGLGGVWKALLQEKIGDIYLNHLENRSKAIAA